MNINVSQIVTSVIGVLGVIIGVMLGQVCTYLSDRRKRKEEFFMVNYQLRQNSYSEIYLALVEYEKYYERFLNTGNEFMEYEEWTNFAPLEGKNAFISIFNKYEIWLDDEIKSFIVGIIDSGSCGCNLAIQIASDDRIFDEQSVRALCQLQVDSIGVIKKKIQQKCAMNNIDKYISKFIE